MLYLVCRHLLLCFQKNPLAPRPENGSPKIPLGSLAVCALDEDVSHTQSRVIPSQRLDQLPLLLH